MKKQILLAAAVLAFAQPAIAQNAEPAQKQEPAPSPNQIVDEAPDEEWVTIPAEDMLVMTLAPDPEGEPREVIIQLMPAPFSQGWVENIRTFARAKWYDGITVNRVQDNYVVQWGDPNYDNPEAQGETKALPDELNSMGEHEYTVPPPISLAERDRAHFEQLLKLVERGAEVVAEYQDGGDGSKFEDEFELVFNYKTDDLIGDVVGHLGGFPYASDIESIWPVHCYGMVGVGRGYSPDTGSGAELYTVIGHAPRHLDRNIALVGRIISGMEHLSSLPRGSGTLGFYSEEEYDKRTPILSVRVVSDLPEMEQPLFEYLSTESETFAKYADARANRRDPFFIHPAGGADICNIPVPIRPTPNG